MAQNLKSANYKLEWIPVRNLAVVWREAQRPYQEAWAKEIAAEFDPDLFDPVKVTLPNGNGIYHICEGQHRVRGVEMLWGQNEMVPCLVAQETDPARAAEIFLGTNTGRNHVNKIAKFKVAVTAGHKIECAIDRITRHNGYRVEGSHAQDTIAAVEGLHFAYNKAPKTLDRTLHVIRDTWSGDPAAVAAPILKGYASVICEFSAEIDFARLRTVMDKRYHSPGKLLIDARSVKELNHWSLSASVEYLILRTYNKGWRKPLKRKST
jgi:uncharacterized protein DUF6551